MARELRPDLWWVGACFPLSGRHLDFSVYLLTYGDSNVLIDTGPFNFREPILEEVRTVIDGDLDAIVISASDYVHTGNLSPFKERPDLHVITVGNPTIHGYEDYEHVTRVSVDEAFDVGGTTLRMQDPVLHDVASTAWIYEPRSKALFTSDSFGYYHAPDDCGGLGDDGVDPDALYDFHADTLRWLPYVRPERVEEEVEYVFDRFDVECLLPAHGKPVMGEDVPGFVDAFVEAIHRAPAERSASGAGPTSSY